MSIQIKQRVQQKGKDSFKEPSNKPGTHDVFYLVMHHQGKREKMRIPGKGKEALKLANETKKQLEAKIALKKPIFRVSTPTVNDYFEIFKETHLATSVKKSTANNYEQNFKNHILPELGKLPLDEISRTRIDHFIAGLMKKTVEIKRKKKPPITKSLSKDTIRLILAGLRLLLNHAVERGVITSHSATKLSKLYKQASKVHKEITPLTADEVRLFLEESAKNSPYWFPLFLCAIHTGLRAGELIGLQWGDIDFNAKYLTVRRNVVRGKVGTTKTDKSRLAIKTGFSTSRNKKIGARGQRSKRH